MTCEYLIHLLSYVLMFDAHGAVDLLARDPDQPTRAELDEILAITEAARSWITAREARWLRAGADVPPDPSDPAKDDADRLARKQKTSRAKAKTRSDTARQLGDLPETQDALENGTITDAHADAMAHARATADAQARAALDEHEADLLALGAQESPWDFKQRLARFVKAHSADDGRSEWDRKQAQAGLRMWDDKDGMLQLRGQLPPGTPKAVVRRVLGGISDELFRRDHRDHPQDTPIPFGERDNEARLAEALVEACRRAEGQAHPTTSHDRVVVTLTLQDLFGTPHDGPGPTMNDGTPVPASVARRMACEAGIIPLVLGGDSVPLDLGRTRRVASPGQRVAEGALWSTCSFADCTTTYAWCELHHVRPFNADGGHGKTNLDELTPVCGHCHDLAHHPDWHFEKLRDGSTLTRAPDGTEWRRWPDRQRPAEPPPAAATEPGTPDQPAATLFTDAA